MNAPMRAALKLAAQSKCNYHLGSALAKGNKVVGLGINFARSHPQGSGIFKSFHAEVGAVLSFLRLDKQFLKGYEIYVARVSKTGKIGMARPCKDCLSFLKGFGIQHIHYTTHIGNWKEEKI